MYYNGVVDYDKMNDEDFKNLAKDRLVEIKGRLENLPADMTDRCLNPCSYADFLEGTALIDFFIKKDMWGGAESIACRFSRSYFTSVRRCVMILKKILEDSNV